MQEPLNITLSEATEINYIEIHKMQNAAFKPLLDKYQDFNTNPGNETPERVRQRFNSSTIKHYFIIKDIIKIGYIRIVQLDKQTCRLSQIFIMPEFQNKGYAQSAIAEVEILYPLAQKWELDTIKQEKKLCRLYEKMGYYPTGEEKRIKENMTLIFYMKIKPQ